MKREKARIIILYILLILIFGLIYIYNDYSNRTREVDRKVNIMFNKYHYDEVVKECNTLFLDAIYISDSNNLAIELNRYNRIKYYVIDDYNNYKKVINAPLIITTLTKRGVAKYLEAKRIINYKNEYYIEDYIEKVNKDYIGSMLDILKYDANNITLNATNYYCKDHSYIGVLDDEPNCKFEKTNTEVDIVLEDGLLKIDNIEDIMQIIA